MRVARVRLGLPACAPGAMLTALCLSVVLAACGSSTHKSSSAAGAKSITAGALATSQAVSAATTTTTSSQTGHKAAAKKAKSSSGSKHKSSGGSTSQTTHTTAPSSTTSSTATHSTTTTHTTSSHTTPAARTVHGLPSPEITAASGRVRVWLHAPNHSPTVGKRWHYQVLAADASGHPLAGTVDTEFVFNGTVVGREAPPTHPLTQGLLKDGVTYPAPSIGIQLTFRVVIHTHLGSVTLNWPVKSHK
jgi:hypothetical protein